MIHPKTLRSLEFGKVVEFVASLCLSASGRELALELRPRSSIDEANADFALCEEARSLFSGGAFVAASFPSAAGLLRIVKSPRDAASPRSPRPDIDAFWLLRQTLALAQKAYSAIDSPQAPTLWPMLLSRVEENPFPAQLFAALNRCVSDDGLLRDESSPELYRLRTEMRRLHQTCLRKVKNFARQYNIENYLRDDFMTLSSDRYVLPLKANFKGRLQGVIHDWSQTGETCYFEPIFLVEINNRSQELKREERIEEGKILAYLASLLEAEIDNVIGCEDLLSLLDLLNAKLKFADILDAHPPTFAPDEEGVSALAARHPILALARLEDKGELPTVRPLDIILRPGERVLVITGGNAGGKTVCLKTLGLVSAMAMSGLPIPAAKGSRLPWFDRLDAFIGDEQSLEDNVSTFTAQIDHLAKAWKHLDSRGLVLLDEFGAGTDPAEGAALAQAVLDELLEKRCFVLAATHFPALKTYGLSKPGVRAASMLFDPRSGRPLFRLAYDQIGASQALEVAETHGLPESIIKRARHYLLQDGADSAAVLARLNTLAAKREEEIAFLEREREKTRRKLAEKEERLNREKEKLAGELRRKIAELMSERKAEKISAKQAAKTLSGLRAELGLPEKTGEESVLSRPGAFAPGQTVFHTLFNKRGQVIDVDERRDRVRVDLNGVSLWANAADLRDVAAPAPKAPPPSVKLAPEAVAMSLDARGLRAAEAVARTEKFIDKALLSGFSQVEIIHGRGTGALRRELHEFLRSFPLVRSVQLAPEDRGGDGVTIVNLK
ncbi:MAG: Smr/MutS family protein [Desulfovibrio sp.]|nr:Smr/MutS family protein [Desulfovibrio sp.]